MRDTPFEEPVERLARPGGLAMDDETGVIPWQEGRGMRPWRAVRAEQAVERVEGDDDQFVRRERRHKSVSRTITHPAVVEADEASADYHDGVLSVTLPRRHESDDARRIDVARRRGRPPRRA